MTKTSSKFLKAAALRLVSKQYASVLPNGTAHGTNGSAHATNGNGSAHGTNGTAKLVLGAAAPAVVRAPVRHPLARRVTFRPPHAGEEKQFLLEEWTTEFGDGTRSTDYVWVRGQYALVVPIVDGQMVFIRQYKKAAGRTLLVLPWGGIEQGEAPLDAGRRELEEETGYSFRTAEVYGPFHDLPDKSTGGHWVIVARNAYFKSAAAPDHGERISGVQLIPVGQLWQCQMPVLMHVGALRLAGF